MLTNIGLHVATFLWGIGKFAEPDQTLLKEQRLIRVSTVCLQIVLFNFEQNCKIPPNIP